MTTNTTALVKQLRNALIDARDDVQAELQRCTELAGRPATDRRLAAQVALALDVDIAIADAEKWLAAPQAVAQPLTDEQTRADAARWREMRRVFHVTEHIGKTTCMPATKLSCHWHGWASGDHADVTGCVDALIYERANGIGKPAVEDKPCRCGPDGCADSACPGRTA